MNSKRLGTVCIAWRLLGTAAAADRSWVYVGILRAAVVRGFKVLSP
jgi:hypothetical protein